MPGRVVTLIYTGNPEDKVWGTAFKVAPENISSVIEYLDYREKNGYSKQKIDFYPNTRNVSDTRSSNECDIMVPCQEDIIQVEAYIADETNDHYLGPAPPNFIARQIVQCQGISGPNLEYLTQLCATLAAITPSNQNFDPDGHLSLLTEHVKMILSLDKEGNDTTSSSFEEKGTIDDYRETAKTKNKISITSDSLEKSGIDHGFKAGCAGLVCFADWSSLSAPKPSKAS
ncbi:unnamed protein product [Gordionus sp. m RMFG-2023]